MTTGKTVRTLAAALAGAGVALWLLQPACAETPEIRVVLADAAQTAQVGGDLDWSAGKASIGRSTDVTTVKLSNFGVKVDVAGKINEAPRLVASTANGFVRFGGQHYRGRLEFFPGKDGGVVVLNVLPLEDYLLGVVPAEMPSSWPAEALKAQAVAARTYALSRIAARRESSFDVYATVADQAYKGVSGEDPRSTAAVQGTAGMLVTYAGEPIIAYYCSDCGGCTCRGEQPYLRSVPIDVPDSPHNYWKITMDSTELDEAIRGTGGSVGRIERLVVERDAQSGHLATLTFYGSKGSHSIGANKLRRILGYNVMKSTRVAVEPLDTDIKKKIINQPIVSGSQPAFDPLINKVDTIQPGGAIEVDAPAGVASINSVGSGGEAIEVGMGDLQTMQGWSKPWVASAAESLEQKMRALYAFDGVNLLRCNREVHLWDVSGLPVALAAEPPDNELVIEASHIEESHIDAPPSLPALGSPTPLSDERQYTRVEYSRAGGISGIVLHGSGYGHGLGMSQWGAKQLASQGYSFGEILAYFYQGTQVEGWGGVLPQLQAAAQDEEAVEVQEFYQPFTPVETVE